MNGDLAKNATLLADLALSLGSAPVEVGVCVPFPYLHQAQQLLQGSVVNWGAQNLSSIDSGAHTGEVSAEMLRDFNCTWVIVGHSERRALYGENDRVVAEKLIAAQRAGLKPVLCVGETLAERQAGEAELVVARQLAAALDGLGQDVLSTMTIAYEPVWAIGTGVTASTADVEAMHAFVRSFLSNLCAQCATSVRLLYGGSVNAGNAAQLFGLANVDGGLIGGASLNSASFLAICAAAAAA
jgi:triosephosphate isomerase